MPVASESLAIGRPLPSGARQHWRAENGVALLTLAIIASRPALSPVFELVRDNGSMSPGALVNAAVLLLGLFALLRHTGAALFPVLLWASFLVAASLSLRNTPDTPNSVRALLSWVTYASMFVLPFTFVRSWKVAKACYAMALASSIIPVIYGFVQLATGHLDEDGEFRIQSTFSHANIFAFYLVGAAALCLYLVSSNRVVISARSRTYLYVYLIPLVILLVGTKTRSAWIAFGLLWTVNAIFVDRRFLPTLFLAPFLLLIPSVSERLTDLEYGTVAMGYEPLNSYAWRKALWEETERWLLTNPTPFFGYGVSSFGVYAAQIVANPSREGIDAHNSYLQIAFECGPAGLLTGAWLGIGVLLKVIAGLRQDFRGGMIMLAFATGFALELYSDNLTGYLEYQWFFWFMLGTYFASGSLRPARVVAKQHPTSASVKTGVEYSA